MPKSSRFAAAGTRSSFGPPGWRRQRGTGELTHETRDRSVSLAGSLASTLARVVRLEEETRVRKMLCVVRF